jgi:hypothetical protein|tara:strand:- start:29854 stop:30198 length:345 start_codon:yes stop_codon:yes gene_type:complete
MMQATLVPPRSILVIVLGFGVWTVAFVGLYAVNAIGCAFAWPSTVQRAVMIGLALAASGSMMAVAGWSIGHWRRAANAPRPAPGLARIGAMGSTAALAATILVFAPSLFASMCL